MNTLILTGASRGLGSALSEEILKIFSAQDQKIFISRQSMINCKNNNFIEYLQIDLSKDSVSLEKIKINNKSKQVILINNAGVVSPIAKSLDISLCDLNVPMNVNFKNAFRLAQYLSIETQRLGANLLILNVSSGAASRPIQGWLAYCVSKASMRMALDVLELENDHVSIIHFDPGIMDTDMQSTIRSASSKIMPDVEMFKAFKSELKLKSPTDVAINICNIIKESML